MDIEETNIIKVGKWEGNQTVIQIGQDEVVVGFKGKIFE